MRLITAFDTLLCEVVHSLNKMDHTELEPTNICVSWVGEVTYIGPHGPPLDRTLRSANAANL